MIFHSNCYISASFDNLRLWNVAEAKEPESGRTKGGVQFKIIPGHHGGYVSQMRKYFPVLCTIIL